MTVDSERLNLGCGTDIRPACVNLDKAALPGVDVVHDIEVFPFPFKDGQFEEIYAKDILEHVEYIPVLKELHRIMKPGGRLEILAPHFTSMNFWSDPTHKHAFAVRTFSFFARDNPNFKWEGRSYYFDFSFSKIAFVRITFPRHFPWDRINEWLVNLHPKLQMVYELTMWSRLFPAENVHVGIVK
jgi:SAM-dependent methyltransferase